MDHQIFELLQPVIIIGSLSVVPIAIVSLVSFFRHKARQLEVMREVRSLELNNERLQLEARLRQLEMAVSQLGGGQLVPPPSLPEGPHDGARTPRKERA